MKHLSLLVLLVSITLSLWALPPSENTFGINALSRALQLKNKVDAANQSDIVTLADDLLRELDRLSEDEVARFWVDLESKINSDRETLQAIQPSATINDSIELTTTLGKLIGDEKHPGILEDALVLMKGAEKRPEFFQDLKTLKLENNQITGYKTLLIYANVVVTQQKNLSHLVQKGSYEGRIQYLYPLPLPAEVDTNLIETVALYCRPMGQASGRLFGPNDFYVYGGTPPELETGTCHGSDCTGLLTYCMKSSVRLSTMILEFVWRYIRHGENGFAPEEKKAFENLVDQYHLKQISELYEALDPDPDKLLPGDIVVWRMPGHKSPRAGHAALFVKLMDGGGPGLFQGVEATRDDNKSLKGKTKEGLLLSIDLTVRREGRDTYVLRHK
jgi:hypothetical protein